MDTIIRDSSYGYVLVIPTVLRTIRRLMETKPGFYSIEDIQRAINEQVEEKERLTYRKIQKAVVEILS